MLYINELNVFKSIFFPNKNTSFLKKNKGIWAGYCHRSLKPLQSNTFLQRLGHF